MTRRSVGDIEHTQCRRGIPGDPVGKPAGAAVREQTDAILDGRPGPAITAGKACPGFGQSRKPEHAWPALASGFTCSPVQLSFDMLHQGDCGIDGCDDTGPQGYAERVEVSGAPASRRGLTCVQEGATEPADEDGADPRLEATGRSEEVMETDTCGRVDERR